MLLKINGFLFIVVEIGDWQLMKNKGMVILDLHFHKKNLRKCKMLWTIV